MSQEFSKGVSTRLTEEMFLDLKALAQEEQRPISNMVRVLLTEAMEYRKLGISQNDLSKLIKTKKGK